MPVYPIACELSGPTAMWTRADTGDAPVSNPAPSFAAVKEIFESIVWLKSAAVVPKRVEICAPKKLNRGRRSNDLLRSHG